MALRRTDAAQGAAQPTATPAGYGPADLRSAYNLPATGGSGATVAIVDAYDDPNAESDLAAYRKQYGLTACTTANGCFAKVNQRGAATGLPKADSSWAGEISLDLDAVSAVCPQCHILLVEADSNSLSDLGAAVNRAVVLGARYISNSYAAPEASGDLSYDNAYYNHPGVVITASSGDDGYGVVYPAASPYVTAVGGTSLSRASNARGWTEAVWGSSSGGLAAGSGCSAYESKPTWQTDTGCSRRTVADVSAVADPNTGIAVYDSYQSAGWTILGGTSAAAPIIAAVYALAGLPGATDLPAAYPYRHISALNDVSSGANGSCAGSYLCTGTRGYDGPTGLGTPNGVSAFASGGGTGPAAGSITLTGTGACADVNDSSTADGARITLWTCHGGANQTWTRVGSTYQSLGKCLDVTGGATAANTAVELWTCNGGVAQEWTAGGNGSLVNPHSGRCLDASGGSTANGTRLIIWDCTGGSNQRWTAPS